MTKREAHKKVKEMEQKFFLTYSEHFCECIAFLNQKWVLIKQVIEMNLNLKKAEDCCPNELMLADLHIRDLEAQYGPFC